MNYQDFTDQGRDRYGRKSPILNESGLSFPCTPTVCFIHVIQKMHRNISDLFP